MNRREWLITSAALAVQATGVTGLVRASTTHQFSHGNLSVTVLSDGHLSIPASMVMPEGADEEHPARALLTGESDASLYTPDCNITLVKSGDRLMLFDVGAGPYFMDTAGKLADSLAAQGIASGAVTDVVFTHAHPDHLWGLTDDFDDLVFPNARYFMSRKEVDYWLDDNTLQRTPESRQSFVAGARNRLNILDDQLERFEFGDEILPGVEAIDTSGHTPGHTAFALHEGSESLIVLGDALAHHTVSFAHPTATGAMDQAPEQAAQTRVTLLDRLSREQSLLLGFHLSFPGVGRAERSATAGSYVYVPAS